MTPKDRSRRKAQAPKRRDETGREANHAAENLSQISFRYSRLRLLGFRG
jgi:hypothetical protein